MKVGNTPLIKLSDKLYGKYEALNPGGSIKDRPVKYILDSMDLNKGDTHNKGEQSSDWEKRELRFSLFLYTH